MKSTCHFEADAENLHRAQGVQKIFMNNQHCSIMHSLTLHVNSSSTRVKLLPKPSLY